MSEQRDFSRRPNPVEPREFKGSWEQAKKAACSCPPIYWIETMDGYAEECCRCGAQVVYMDKNEFKLYPGKNLPE